jgi:hypothetical protein
VSIWPTKQEDLKLLADELCYPSEGDRCFDGRDPKDLKAFLDKHPAYRNWHSNASDATFAAPPSAVVEQQAPRLKTSQMRLAEIDAERERLGRERLSCAQQQSACTTSCSKTSADSSIWTACLNKCAAEMASCVAPIDAERKKIDDEGNKINR